MAVAEALGASQPNPQPASVRPRHPATRRGLHNSAGATCVTARPARARSIPDLVGADRLLRRQPLHIQPHPPSLGDDVEGNAVLALELGRDAEPPCGVVLGTRAALPPAARRRDASP